MYIPAFWCGVLLTIFVELVLVFGAALISHYLGGNENEEIDEENNEQN